MYKDVKKKLLSVALCICMVIGAVQVVPRAKAATTTKTDIKFTLEGSVGTNNRNITVEYDMPNNLTYDGNAHMPTLKNVYDVTDGNQESVSGCTLTTSAEPRNAGTYKVYLNYSGKKYDNVSNLELGTFTISKATILRPNFVWDGVTLALQDSIKGVTPNFRVAQLVLSDGVSTVDLTPDQYEINPITKVGSQSCSIKIKDDVKSNFTNDKDDSVYSPTIPNCIVAYDLQKNDQYSLAFKTSGGTASLKGEGEYTGSAFTPELGIYKKDGDSLKFYSDIDTSKFSVTFKKTGAANAPASTVLEAGTYDVIVKPQNNSVAIANNQYFTGTFESTYTVKGKSVDGLKVFVQNPLPGGENINMNSDSARLILDYKDGEEVCPTVVTVQDENGNEIPCTYTYENANGVGTAYMYVHPDPAYNYAGSLKLAYSISSKLELGTIRFDGYADNTKDLYYTKKIQLPIKLEVRNKKGTVLTEGENAHYIVTYNYQDSAGQWQTTELSKLAASKDDHMATSGTKRITIHGRGIYAGQKVSETYTIDKVRFEDHTSWFELNVKEAGPFYYNGHEHKPAVEVIYKNKYGADVVLDSNDVSVSYLDNVDAGSAKITVTATKNSNFAGTMTTNFTIQRVNLADVVVEGDRGTSYIYNRTVIRPKFVIDGGSYGSSYKYELEENRDYEIVNEDGTEFTGTLPSDCGTYSVWIQSQNANITNSNVLPIKKTYEITQKDIATIGFTLDGVTDGKIEWWGKDTRPDVISALAEGADYTCAYNNCSGVGNASVTITAKDGGNYKGSTTLNYTITKRSLGNRSIEASASAAVGAGNKFKIDLTVTDNGEGVKQPNLVKDTDYEVTHIEYLTSTDTVYTPSATDISALEKAGEYEITLSGKNNYDGTKKVRVGCGKDISDAKISLGVTDLTYTYNTKVQTPTTISLQLADGGTASLAKGDFTVTYSRKDGTAPEQATINAGRVYVTVTGNPAKGYYGFTTVGMDDSDAYYTIQPLNIKSTSNLYSVKITDSHATTDKDGNITFPFANEAIKPSVRVEKDNQNADLPGELDSTMYDIVYGSNGDECINAATHAIIVTGKGNYTGTIRTSFIITPMPITNSKITAEWDSHINYADGIPRLTLRLNGADELIEGKDYEKGITWRKDGVEWSNTCVYTVTGVNNYIGTKEFTYTKTAIAFKKAADNNNPQEGEIFISKWNMKELLIDPANPVKVTPVAFTVSYKTKGGDVRNLVKDKDFKIVDYGTNTAPGVQGNSVTIEGMGEFAGTVEFPLTLYTDIDKASFVTSATGSGSILYDGAKISMQRLSQAIKDGTLSELVTLKALWPEEGATINTKNYTVNLPNSYVPEMGNVTITIEGSQQEPHYYAGVKTITVRVTGELDSSQLKVTIGNNNSVLYEGKAVTPGGVTYSVYSISSDQKRLLKGIDEATYLADPTLYADYDYTISFTDNTGIGLATAHITGINDYSGFLTQPFKIYYPFSDLTLQLLNDEKTEWVTYSGGMIYTYNIDAEQNKPSVRLYYTGKGMLPESQWELIDQSLYTLVYDGYERAGDAKILVSGSEKEDYRGILTGNGKTVSYKLNPIALSGVDSSVTLRMEYTPMYTGNPITAQDGLNLTLTYRNSGYELVEGTDYRVQYENNVNASTDDAEGIVYINGMGNFAGSRIEKFRVQTMSISSATDISVDVKPVTYTGNPEKPQLQINQKTGRQHTLVEGVDYEIKEYWNGANIHQSDPFSAISSSDYYVVVIGKGNYSGTREIPYTIVERDLNDGVDITFISSDTCKVVDGIPTCIYDGTEHKPTVRVTFNGVQLKGPDETLTPDYTLKYASNKNAGIATVTVTGNSSFGGTRTLEFRIQPKDIASEDIAYLNEKNAEFLNEQNFAFTNKPIEPEIHVYDHGVVGVPELANGSDYNITYTDDNGDNNEHRYAGLVTMTITGQNNYTGTQEFTYYIGEDISKAYTLVNGSRSLTTTYTGLEQAPDENAITVETTSSTLKLKNDDGTDRYNIAYYKNGFEKSDLVNRDQIIDAATYYIAVVGVPSKGTYAKTSESNSCAYTIYPRSIAPSYVLVSGYDGSYYYTGQPIEPKAITVEDTDLPVTSDQADPQRRSVKLVNGTDYDISYTNNTSAGKASIIVTGKGNYSGNRVAYFNIVSSNTDGNNTWDGTSEGTGSISNGSTTISAKDIILGYDSTTYNCMMYNGYERIPTVSINGLSNSDFVITASNNIRPGVATLMITGINNYTGTIYKNYTIKADLSTYGTVSTIVDQSYTGYQITPYVTVTCGGNLLTVGNDYTVTYANNTNVGRATVIATAAANSYYVGTANGYFNISNTATGMEITGYASSYTYTGNAITPDVIVTMNGRMLNRGTDYVVSYSNNTNVGTATMTVTGIGSFSGTKTINYVIEAKNIENCITTAVNNYQYTGNTYTPSVTLTDSSTGKTLAAGTDYTITYSNNTNPGTASITVTALSRNYTGSKVISFKITSAAVSGLRVSRIKNNSMKLSWSDQDYADGYQICNANNRVIGTTSNNSYTVKRLTSCTTYRYKVRSYVENADGSVSYGNFSTAVAAQTMLNTPTLKARSTTRGNVTLTWSKVAKASGYEIYYSTEKNGIYTKLKTVSKSSARRYVDSGLASGEKYYYTIRAYRTVNGVKTYSSYNTIKSATVK